MAKKDMDLYTRRWVVLASVGFLNNTNAFLWIAFAAVANHVNVFYGNSQAANWFSLIFILCTIPVGIIAMWAASKFGLRASLLIAAWANGIGTVIRFISSFVPQVLRFPVGILGQGISACAYPFIMFLPTKVAGTWFADNERTLATTIGVMANPLGVLMANLLSPQIVNSYNDVPKMNAIVMFPAIITCLLVTFGVNSSKPKTPPTLSAAVTQTDFLTGIKDCYSNKAYVILAITLGGGIGMFNCLYTVIQQLLCPSGYTNAFSGLCASLMIVGGLIGATAAGLFVDRTKLYEETLKVSYAFAVISGLLFLQLEYATYIASFLFGVFGLAAYPVGLELSAECTFPVPENLSTGFIVIVGQVSPFIITFLPALLALLLILVFRPKLKRLQTERKPVQEEQVLSAENCGPEGDVGKDVELSSGGL
ncbi:unnamed protein product [Enterobius vermicularis]|uniref:MFS domain-containing protein n=1 Tax=Enterobius vermicularis TaxID=51028 RepID=A0A0N4VKW0_ENTVE|nr:unnamed protein product [Enterobius vermicularis]